MWWLRTLAMERATDRRPVRLCVVVARSLGWAINGRERRAMCRGCRRRRLAGCRWARRVRCSHVKADPKSGLNVETTPSSYMKRPSIWEASRQETPRRCPPDTPPSSLRQPLHRQPLPGTPFSYTAHICLLHRVLLLQCSLHTIFPAGATLL